MRAILLGATGASGGVLLRELLDDASFTSVSAYTRRPLEIKHEKLQNHVIDFDRILELELLGADVLFSTLGTTIKDAGSKQAQYKVDVTYQLEFAKKAHEAGIQTLVLLSSAGADEKSCAFYTRIKGELEEAVKDLGFKSVSIFRPSILLRAHRLRLGEKISLSVLNFFNKFGLFKRFAPQDLTNLAKAMIKASKSGKTGAHLYKLDEIDAILD
ncbi:NAD(P)H-binding protein [Campylobacter sp. 19-13652]|uniref:NAD(P)H-binding protein n=1 Tax=Campylobacter sp. 19-13652 TaxID=2840180 RepID=UPI001C74486E|nr:NAD(P)H-binding protein [Campylobacter sp. 19-13652]BCX80138.1 oxidoreductase [Campylobacter sp. 19-13652]